MDRGGGFCRGFEERNAGPFGCGFGFTLAGEMKQGAWVLPVGFEDEDPGQRLPLRESLMGILRLVYPACLLVSWIGG